MAKRFREWQGVDEGGLEEYDPTSRYQSDPVYVLESDYVSMLAAVSKMIKHVVRHEEGVMRTEYVDCLYDMIDRIDRELEGHKLLDNCEVCHGANGGTRGNENRVNGKVMCDHCHAASTAKKIDPYDLPHEQHPY